MLATHEVSNQAPPLEDFNRYARNLPLIEAVARHGAADADAWLAERGAELGSAAMQALAVQANRNPPTPKLFDSAGRRCDRGGVPSGVPRADGVAEAPWRVGRSVGESRAGCAREARRALHAVRRARGRHALSDDDDVRGRAVARARRRDRARMAAAHLLARLRSAVHPRRTEARRDAGHGDDREAGRIGRARRTRPGRSPSAAATTGSSATNGFSRRRCRTRS